MTGGRSDVTVQRLEVRLRALTETTRIFAEAQSDPARLLQAVARRIGEVVCDQCSVLLVSPEGDGLTPEAVFDRDPSRERLAVEALASHPLLLAEQAMLAKVVASGESVLIPQVELEALRGRTTDPYVEYVRASGIHSVLIVAIRDAGKALGVLVLVRSHSPRPFDDDDVAVAQSLADQAGLWIAQSRARAAENEARVALGRYEREYHVLFESSPVPMFVIDVDRLSFLAVNEAALELYGYSRDEFMAIQAHALRPPGEATAEVVRERVRRLSLAPAGGIAVHRKKSGETFDVEYSTSRILFAGRNAVLSIVTDVTEHRRLAAARAFLASIVEQSNDSIVSTKLDGTIVTWNRAASRLFGYGNEEAVGRNISIILPPQAIQESRDLLGRIAQGQRISGYETVRRRKDGTTFDVLLSVSPIVDEEGRVIGASKIVRDLTEQRRAAEVLRRTEEQLRHAQKMEAVGRLAGGIAHDFNNILSVVLSHSELLAADLDPESPLREDLDEICTAGRRAAELTRQLLMFSRQQVLQPRVLDLNTLLMSMERMLKRVLGEDVDVAFVRAPRLGHVRADPGSLEQVIVNLAVNARDAMPDGGKLTVETADVVLDEAFAREHMGVIPGPHVLLAVTDTGIGMDRATQARIFEPFFTTKGAGRGTGLGLATVFGIVRESGGTIWVYSEPGRGSTFKLYLPRVESELQDSSRWRTMPETLLRGTETVLVVEDEDQVRTAVRNILLRHGYQVIAAHDPQHALRCSREHTGRIDLLLTDVVMPQMSGPELAQLIAAQRPEIRVLCMSGYTDNAALRQGVLESGVAYLQKPITVESLTKKVRQVLAGD